jgi:hypothetical protein
LSFELLAVAFAHPAFAGPRGDGENQAGIVGIGMCPAQIERRKHPGAIGDFQKERGRVFVVRIARAVIVGAVARNGFVAVDRPSMLTVFLKASLASISAIHFQSLRA